MSDQTVKQAISVSNRTMPTTPINPSEMQQDEIRNESTAIVLLSGALQCKTEQQLIVRGVLFNRWRGV